VTPVSERTIESYINLHMKGERGKLALAELRQKGKPREKSPEPRGKLPHMALIDERQGEEGSRDVPKAWGRGSDTWRSA